MDDNELTHMATLGELSPGKMVGEYRIVGRIGKGGMGVVYSAVHPVIAKRAAIKVLHPELSVNQEAVERFVQEARSVNQIGHPNIVDIFAFGALPGGPNYFVMELLRGESLRDRMKRERLPIVEALALTETITLPLQAAHEHGIVHRDVKPDNVFLVETKEDRPQVKLLDFGIAKLSGQGGVQRTRTGSVLGTPAYISPEQARAENVDHRTDIYALGAMLFELVTGELVFPATNSADMIAQHLFEEPRSAAVLNASVVPQLDALITSMLAKDPNVRPTLEQVRNALQACRVLVGGTLTPPQGTPITTGGAVAPVAPAPMAPQMAVVGSAHRSRVPWIAGGLLVAIGVVALILASGNSSDSPAPSPAGTVEVKQQAQDPPPASPVEEPRPVELAPATPVAPVVAPAPAAPAAAPAEKKSKRRPVKRSHQGSGSAAATPHDPDAPM
jgi:tRNA A-37 threonylcarbamoyl transferase component Bud32